MEKDKWEEAKWEEIEIERNMVVSTGHITKEDNDKLEDAASPDSIQNVLVVHSDEYFHLVHVPSADLTAVHKAGYSKQFVRLLSLARMDGDISFLKLDRDGPKHDWLEEYDW